MNCYMLVDFGSTYTKLSLVDIDNEKLIAKSSAHTTVNTNIKFGYEKALEKLKEEISFENIKIVDILGCSSAAGGLKMIAIGITPEFTVEAAKRAATGAGARLLKSYSYFLKEKDILEIDSLNPDIILLTGGAEGGNTKYILYNAKLLNNLKREIPIVVAGNSYANENIREIFNGGNIKYEITENVMPDVNRINADPVREVIRKIFMKQIVTAKGMEDVEKITSEILMPTPTAVLKAAKLLSYGTEKYEGIGDVMVVDIGGATTDVHTISEPIKDKNFFIDGLEETCEKRTVEGDLGMRYSALSLYESVGEENFLKYNSNIENIREKCEFRHNNPSVLSDKESEIEFDEIMAKNCVEISVKRHSGKIRNSYIGGKNVIVQKGKDLREIKLVIGTGGILINSKKSAEILKQCKNKEKNYLLPIDPKFAIDKKYIMSAMGILSMRDENLAYKILTENIIDIND
ncbi:methylaspartate mutase accessory protein GlmL [Peptoniphilus mikwangii]|uniref:methylaspartate mutase accessory protein GlmL n=1 Tax=Peptoniphilus mikwangii TaxID=1354300 RepID=UPI00040B440E|nr:methylaspartate mutase accessory protein GlmL [Peptoniphilus mikwangii]